MVTIIGVVSLSFLLSTVVTYLPEGVVIGFRNIARGPDLQKE